MIEIAVPPTPSFHEPAQLQQSPPRLTHSVGVIKDEFSIEDPEIQPHSPANVPSVAP